MTLAQGKFFAIPPVYEAIQWDGTLEGVTEIYKFINDHVEFGVDRLDYQSRIVDDSGVPVRASITLPQSIVDEAFDDNRQLHKDMWLIYCGRPYSWRIVRQDTFAREYGMVGED